MKVMEEESTEARIEMMKKSEQMMSRKQKRREVQCAVNLAKLLEQYQLDQSEDYVNFRTAMQAEAKELASTAFGGALIGVLVSKNLSRGMYIKNKPRHTLDLNTTLLQV
jgi:hypothetical protein